MRMRRYFVFPAAPALGREHKSVPAASLGNISDILSAVRNFFLLLIIVLAAAVFFPSQLRAAPSSCRPARYADAQQSPPSGQTSEPLQHPSAALHSNAQQHAELPASPPVPIIVLDPAHGGTDTGARGENGLAEKDLVLQIARTLQAQLLTHGYRVVMTRSDDSNPSYDDRAAIANAYRNAVFIAIHVGSTGKMGTVRAYYDRFWSPEPAVPSTAQVPAIGGNSGAPIAKLPANTLVSWRDAQRPFVSASHRLADILQLQFAQAFPGSPVSSTAVPLRDLRSVAEPAVAIEISNISAPSADALLELSGPLSLAIERAIQTFRQGPAVEAP
ncbi:MAG: N-acetylmuramoyl-L-alanine amidase [Candidatus Acidiferrales bacterium]